MRCARYASGRATSKGELHVVRRVEQRGATACDVEIEWPTAALVLYDLTSVYLEGRTCSLARLGHSRDGKPNKPQIVFGLIGNQEGCPVAVEVSAGNTADPATLGAQVAKLRERFGLKQIILVGDRGLITSARIRGAGGYRGAGLDHGVARADHQEPGEAGGLATLAVR